ncbi:flagellar biosynthesis/type III secretory pathway protein FliH [Achromobacter deleyi]|uniref:FliH/SctL family protein n=1 Tax=Achromobacter deleyi TaxID=1353891 RepID=UPI00285AC0ED|nr:FliH/SctL family protein [Achromobacter deleyi]MDR6602111.1 flagellar biosynthesis/type III secretory pathway protein FliH [Achromobacter deleyi]
MKTAPILRQMPVAPSSRLLGQAPQLPPRTPAAFVNAATAKPVQSSTSPLAAPTSAPSALNEAEIEQRSLAMAQRMMKAEAEQLRKAAREEGLKAGREEGLRAAQAQATQQLRAQQERFLVVTDALVAALARDREATEDAALELTMASLARILGQSPDAALVAEIVRQASTQLRDPGQVRIRLAPADIELLKAADIDPKSLAPQAADVQWIADLMVEGGCVLQTAAGNLDARLHKQVSALADALARTYRTRGGQG